MKKDAKYKVVDLFAGGGGFSLASLQAGLDVVFAVENNKWAAETYRNNFYNSSNGASPTLYERDIQQLNPDALKCNHFPNDSCDILLGGPPCQGFSSHRLYDNTIQDARNNLIHTYFSFVEALKPRMFLMENVPGMLWKRHEGQLKIFYKKGNDKGYKILEPVVIDARDFGVPQRRKRVFILGMREDIDTDELVWPPKPTHGSPKAIEQNPKLIPWLTCKSAFGVPPKEDQNNIRMHHCPELVQAFKNTPKNGGSRMDSGRTLPCHENHKGHKDVYGRIDSRQPAPTMTTACVNPSKGRFVHPTRNHGITVRQAARIQTFPDSFVFSGGLQASGMQVGNAVPILLGKVLIEHLAEYLFSSVDFKELNATSRSALALA